MQHLPMYVRARVSVYTGDRDTGVAPGRSCVLYVRRHVYVQWPTRLASTLFLSESRKGACPTFRRRSLEFSFT